MTADTRQTSNQRIKVAFGLKSGVTDLTKPTLAEIQAFNDLSGAINWDSFDFGPKASDLADDRTITDAAGAKTRSYDQFGGTLEFVYPKIGDTTSVYHTAQNVFSTDRTHFIAAVRIGPKSSQAFAAGDVINFYHVLNDGFAVVRPNGNSKISYAYKITFLPQDDIGVNYVIPSATASAVTVSPPTGVTCDVDGTVFLKATYESVNVTVGADWVSDDPSILEMTPHGIGIGRSAGTANVKCSVPGSAAMSSAISVVVS